MGHDVQALTTPIQHQQYPAHRAFADAWQLLSANAGQFNYTEWDFAQGPSENTTGHLIFDTVRSLLQHWPNTRYRNGHTIAPGIIPPGTLLYRGAETPIIPTFPEWTAIDPEHSYLFCPAPRPVESPPSPSSSLSESSSPPSQPTGEGCWRLTLAATRALRVLYFDGSSAVKMRGGPMDSQDLVAWGKVRDAKTHYEQERLGALCRVDGFVRSDLDF